MARDQPGGGRNVESNDQSGALLLATPTTDVRASRRAARARDLTLHASILACAVWAFVGADVISPGQRGRFSGAQKGNDFVQFYVAGTLAREGQFHALVDIAAFREAQAPFLAPGTPYFFPPVYGPQLALLFAPVSWLPYLGAYAAWVLLTLGLTFWSLDTLRCLVPALIPWRTQIVVATLAFPPLGYLVLDGQLSALALAAITLAALALARGRNVFAGAALGLLGYKVSLLAPALAVLVLSGEWSMAASALAVVALQLLVPIPLAGVETLYAYVQNTTAYATAPDLLVRNAYLMASFRTFWSALLPAAPATAAYVASGRRQYSLWHRPRGAARRVRWGGLVC